MYERSSVKEGWLSRLADVSCRVERREERVEWPVNTSSSPLLPPPPPSPLLLTFTRAAAAASLINYEREFPQSSVLGLNAALPSTSCSCGLTVSQFHVKSSYR